MSLTFSVTEKCAPMSQFQVGNRQNENTIFTSLPYPQIRHIKGKDIVPALSLSHLRNKPHILEYRRPIPLLPFLEYFLVGNDNNNNQLYILVCYAGKKRIILLQIDHNN